MNKSKKHLIIGIIIAAVAVIYTFLVTRIDVKPIGPEGSLVGFSTINKAVHEYIGFHKDFYVLTNILGLFPFIGALVFAVIGLKELIEKKSFKLVNNRLYAIACLYILIGLVYLFFELVIINYRPVILNEGLEASYPSSHTMLGITLPLSFAYLIKYFIKSEKKVRALKLLSIVLGCAIIFGRIVSGVHWASDILGGILISTALLLFFISSVEKIDEKET